MLLLMLLSQTEKKLETVLEASLRIAWSNQLEAKLPNDSMDTYIHTRTHTHSFMFYAIHSNSHLKQYQSVTQSANTLITG